MKLELIKYNNGNCLEATIINEDIVIHCQAYADVQITAHLAGGDGTIGMRNELSVDEDCNISSCDWCELGF